MHGLISILYSGVGLHKVEVVYMFCDVMYIYFYFSYKGSGNHLFVCTVLCSSSGLIRISTYSHHNPFLMQIQSKRLDGSESLPVLNVKLQQW